MSPEKEQVTTMILYVDLKCSCCYNKVRKLLCKFPQVRGQVFDEEKNKVTITVVCCDPEKMRDRLCCKGGKAIQSIEIVEPEPPKRCPSPKQTPKVRDPCQQPKPDTEKRPDPKPPKKPQHEPVIVPVKMPDPQLQPQPQPQCEPMPMGPCRPPVAACCQECNEGRGGGPCYHGYGRPVRPGPPVAVCCQECYEGRGGGPCYHGYERPVPPPPGPCYDYGYGYRYRPPCYVCRCDCFSEDNPQGCSIM